MGRSVSFSQHQWLAQARFKTVLNSNGLPPAVVGSGCGTALARRHRAETEKVASL
jgi:hypothetical protein